LLRVTAGRRVGTRAGRRQWRGVAAAVMSVRHGREKTVGGPSTRRRGMASYNEEICEMVENQVNHRQVIVSGITGRLINDD